MTKAFAGIVFIVALAGNSLAQQRAAPDPPRLPIHGMLVRIPSEGAGPEGIVVRISAPAAPRYPEGAPVVVHMAPVGGVDESPLRLTDLGFVELRFLWPGNKSKAQPDGAIWASGGAAPPGTFFDDATARAAASVLAFAAGRTRTIRGKTLQDCLSGTRALTGNSGVIGWSVGGNLAAAAMGLYGNEFPRLQWYASFEAPFGGGMLDGEFGTHFQPNRFYSSERGFFPLDLNILRYGKDLPITNWSGGTPKGAEAFHGSLYLDGNKNGEFERDSDFLFSGIFRSGPAPNVFYSPELTRATRERKVFGSEWPAHIANVQQSEEFFQLQDGVHHIGQIRKKIPRLAVIVEGSVEDHVQTAPDHPHIRIQYEGFRNAGVRWIRLNPDFHYIERVLGRRPPRLIQNMAGKKFEPPAIVAALEPSPSEGGPTSAEAMAAAACELADRVRAKRWNPALSRVLFRTSWHNGGSARER